MRKAVRLPSTPVTLRIEKSDLLESWREITEKILEELLHESLEFRSLVVDRVVHQPVATMFASTSRKSNVPHLETLDSLSPPFQKENIEIRSLYLKTIKTPSSPSQQPAQRFEQRLPSHSNTSALSLLSTMGHQSPAHVLSPTPSML